MSYKREKLMKIMNEIVNFCMKINMKDFTVDYSSHGTITKMSVEGYCENPPIEKLKRLEQILNRPRQEELEELYWSLMGDPHEKDDLEMIGVMVDRGKVEWEDNIVKISIYREKRH